MPLVRYFVLTSGMLLSLLFVLSWYFPGPPAPAASADIDRSTIRIHSNRKWPEAIRIDASVPIVATAPAAAEASLVAATPTAQTPAASALPTGVREAYASARPPAHAAPTIVGRRRLSSVRTTSARRARFAAYRAPEWHDWFVASW